MKTMKILPLLMILILLSCSSQGDLGAKIVDLRVNSYLVDCTGEMEGSCLLVQEGENIGTEDWTLFYFKDDIEGFDYEPGFLYHLKVKKTEIPDPPQDASSIRYELVRIVSKEKQE